MKTTTTSSAPHASTSATSHAHATGTTSPLRQVSAASAPRSSVNLDYRSNVERQSREQKSIGSLLAYVVYGLIAFFVIGAALAAYGANTIFTRLHDQSVTVSDLDQRYAAENRDLTAKLAQTQQTLADAQAQMARQQDLIVKQQDQLNKLMSDSSDNSDAIRQERQARTQETASLRARVRDLEARTGESTTTQRY